MSGGNQVAEPPEKKTRKEKREVSKRKKKINKRKKIIIALIAVVVSVVTVVAVVVPVVAVEAVGRGSIIITFPCCTRARDNCPPWEETGRDRRTAALDNCLYRDYCANFV